VEPREVEPATANEGDSGGHVDVRREDLRNLGDPHRGGIEARSQDLHDVRVEASPELHRLDPSFVRQPVDRLSHPMPWDVRPFPDDETGRFHARQPLRGRRAPGMRRGGDPLLGETAEARGLMRCRRRQMRQDSVGRGVKALPPVPPGHAEGLSEVHLRIWKVEHFFE